MWTVSPGPLEVGDFLFWPCNLLWPHSLIETSERVSGIHRLTFILKQKSFCRVFVLLYYREATGRFHTKTWIRFSLP